MRPWRAMRTRSCAPAPSSPSQAIFDQFAAQTPVGRNGNAEDVAHAICALIENNHVNGVVQPCDGGLRLI